MIVNKLVRESLYRSKKIRNDQMFVLKVGIRKLKSVNLRHPFKKPLNSSVTYVCKIVYIHIHTGNSLSRSSVARKFLVDFLRKISSVRKYRQIFLVNYYSV